jgi:hypothetical protein
MGELAYLSPLRCGMLFSLTLMSIFQIVSAFPHLTAALSRVYLTLYPLLKLLHHQLQPEVVHVLVMPLRYLMELKLQSKFHSFSLIMLYNRILALLSVNLILFLYY